MRDKAVSMLDNLAEQLTKDPRPLNSIVANNPQYSTNRTQNTIVGLKEDLAKFDISTFSLVGKSKEMRSKMLADKYVMDRLAILGQATVIYAKPNTGKTLLTMFKVIEGIKSGGIKGEDVFYVNADDSFKGLVSKLELAEQYGFHMLAPGHNRFESKQFLAYLETLIAQETASGKVIILDTLKKFTDPMDKKQTSQFMTVARQFVSHGGTLIMLAHTNKNRDADGKVVFGGTSDIVDDVDCAFTLDEVETNDTTKRVLFENIKNRGDVARELAYEYSIAEGQHYHQLIGSIVELDKTDVEAAVAAKELADKLARNSEAIDAIIDAIEAGHTQKTDLIKYAIDNSGISRRKIIKTLADHTGTFFAKGHRWNETKCDKNARTFYVVRSLLPISAEAYQHAKMKN